MPTLADFRAWWINSGEDLSQTHRIHMRDKGWTDFTDWKPPPAQPDQVSIAETLYAISAC